MNMNRIKDPDLHIMVDLETLSTESNAAIVSIGACRFTPEAGPLDSFYATVDMATCNINGAHIDPGTVKWWLMQSDEARKAIAGPDAARTLHMVLADFSDWIHQMQIMYSSARPLVGLWGNGASFDNVILRSAYKAAGMKVPWSYRADRCFRTVKAEFDPVKMEPMEGTAHNALDDACYQATYLAKLWSRENE